MGRNDVELTMLMKWVAGKYNEELVYLDDMVV